jgi:hypothetical protein
MSHFVIPSEARNLALLFVPRFGQCRARFLAEFTLSGIARSFASLRMTSEGLGIASE